MRVQTELRRSLGFSVVLLVAAVPLGIIACGSDSEPSDKDEPPKQTAAQKACAMVTDYVTQCGGGPCDEAIATDCEDVAGMLSDQALGKITECIGSGGAPLGCMVASVSGLTPTPAHDELVKSFCNGCVSFGAETCIDTFFAEDSAVAAARNVLLPLGDDLVNQIGAECTTGSLCATTFLECAKGVIAKRAIPEATLTCVVNTLLDPASVPEAPPCSLGGGAGSEGGDDAASGASSGTGEPGATSSSGSSTSSASSGSSSSGGSTCDYADSCDSCVLCAENGPCAAALDACFVDNAECQLLADCLYPCVDDACMQACVDTYPGGWDDYMAAADCLYCDVCATACGAAGCS